MVMNSKHWQLSQRKHLLFYLLTYKQYRYICAA